MTEHDNDAESRLRAMLRDAAVEIHPSRPAPGLVGQHRSHR